MRRLKIGIRPQLILLVTFACLFSLLILAIICGIYFSNNLGDLRSERLEVISQLKTSQVTQAIDYLFYQVYYLTTRDAIASPLTNYRAGNISDSVFDQAQLSLDQFLTSSESFAAARLYNLDLTVVAESINNVSSVSTPAMDFLYPLQQNLSIPGDINNLGNEISSYYFTGPVSNNSDPDSAYFIGITYPVFANTSIILSTPSIAGYLSVITNANNIQQAVNDSSTAALPDQTTQDYNVMAISPVYQINTDTLENELIGFEAVFPIRGTSLESNVVYNINSSSAVKDALVNEFGSSTKGKNIDHQKVATGYSRITLDRATYWSIIIEQKLLTFNAPIDQFRNIIIGVSFGIGAFVCLITFPLTVLFIRPITKLKEATEAITRFKREKERGIDFSEKSPPPPYYLTLIRRMNKQDDKDKDKDNLPNGSLNPTSPQKDVVSKRNSVHSSGTGGSNSVYSTGIRLPSKIPHSKKIFKDELTELTEAFNIMREELEKQYLHLEDRVKMRTKELEASKIEAEAANEAKTVFIANISHELRTPLNGILGMTSIAMEEEDQSRIKDSLKLINRSGELLLHILTELLTYSKNTLNRSKLEKSSFQILEIVYQVQSIFSKLANDQRVFFKILVKPNILRKLILYGDSNRIIQVVMNLVSNSLKFTPVDGRVDVNFKLLGEYDFQKSKDNGHNNVCVVSHSGNSPNNPYDGEPPQGPEKEVENSSVSSGPFDSDHVSVATLSTAEYENVVFQSQFKPLPDLPEVSVNGSTKDVGNGVVENVNGSANEIFKGDVTNESANGGVREELKENVIPNNTTPSDANPPNPSDTNPPNPILLPPPNMRVQRPSVTSLDSSLNSNELVKNNKVYKIKNLYKPKTWVLQIEVSDTGPGIEPALQEKVFEPFIQGDQTLSRSYGGTGLGLAICRQLARMMKGTMTLKSTLGVGSTFTFTVPLPQVGEILVPEDDMQEFCEDEFNAKSKANRKVAFTTSKDEIIEEGAKETKVDTPVQKSDTAPTSTLSPIKPPRLINLGRGSSTRSDEDTSAVSGSSDSSNKRKYKPHLATRGSTGTANSSSGLEKPEITSHLLLDDLLHLKILVAEDNMVNQEVIKRMLSLEGFTNITMASNGAEAIDDVKESIESNEVFDLIFMDVQMPKIDGLLATKMLRSNLNYDKPIIALTAFADESNVKECLNCGMSGFLAKPIRRTNLRKIIMEFSPQLLSDATTPQTHQSEEKRLGY